MLRLFSLIFSIAGATCAGIGVIIALVIGQDTLQPILLWAAGGTVVGLGASWIVARKLLDGQTV
ncbi:MAG: CTP synthetase [Roseinatronobacter sp.]